MRDALSYPQIRQGLDYLGLAQNIFEVASGKKMKSC